MTIMVVVVSETGDLIGIGSDAEPDEETVDTAVMMAAEVVRAAIESGNLAASVPADLAPVSTRTAGYL